MSSDDPELEVVHEGGEGLAGENRRLVSGTTTTDWGGGRVRPGDSRTFDRSDGDVARGGSVHVVRVADGTSSTLRSSAIPV